ncbi:MAG: four helix bundle protein [Bacteroidales bacterium]|nr:four helix bundle protein [Bacteroidales bacterium]
MVEMDLNKRTKKFAHDCVKISMQFPNNKLGMHLQGQLIRCSTFVAANYRAACIAQSKKSFVSKLSIALEEVDESHFWLEFARDESVLSNTEQLHLLINESSELTAIFISSRKTAQKNANAKIINH